MKRATETVLNGLRDTLYSLFGIRWGTDDEQAVAADEALRAYQEIRKSHLTSVLEARLGETTRIRSCGVTFDAKFEPENQAVWTSSLGAEPYLPTEVFVVVSELLSANGSAPLGDAMKGRLGDPELPLESVEGAVAQQVFGMKQGDRVFRRVGAIAALMVHLHLARYHANNGRLESPGANVYVRPAEPADGGEVLHSGA